MAHWPARLGYAAGGDQLRDTAASQLSWIVVTAHATNANALGSIVPLIASTSRTTELMIVSFQGSSLSTVHSAMLMDILIGASGQEKVLIPKLAVGFVLSAGKNNSSREPHRYEIPIHVPAGSRLSAQMQCATANRSVEVSLDLYGGMPGGGFVTGAGIDAWGADTATSKGVALTTGLANSEPAAWTELVASTPNRVKGLMIGPQCRDGSVPTAGYLVDIGVGSLAAEKEILTDVPFNITSNEDIHDHQGRGVYLLDAPIPAGSRIAARARGTINTNDGLNVVVYGVR